MSGRRQAEEAARRQRRTRTWIVWLFWPYIVISLTVPWLVVALMTNDFGPTGDFWAPVRTVGAWAMPVFDDAIGIAGVVATILVATAATTGFGGDWSAIAERARAPIQATLVLSLATLAAISSLSLPAIAADSAVLPRALVIAVAGWLISFVGVSIIAVATPEQQLARAKADLVDRRARVGRLAGNLAGDTDPTALRRAEAMAWAVPVSSWVVAAVVPLGLQLGGTAYLGQAMGIAAGLLLGQLLILIGWRASADRSARGAARWFIRVLLALPALGLATSVAIVLLPTALAWLGWVTIAFYVTLTTVLYVEPLSRHVPWVRLIQDASTRRSLHRAGEVYQQLRARLAEAAAATSEPVTAHVVKSERGIPRPVSAFRSIRVFTTNLFGVRRPRSR